MNIANAITLSRLPLLFIIVGFLYSEKKNSASIGFILFTFAAWTDWLDGFLARKYKITSSLGAFIDAVTDKIFMIGTFITMLLINIVPHWSLFLIILILLREFLITALRAVAATQQVVIKAESAGKFKTILQMSSTILLLLWFAIKKDFSSLLNDYYLKILYFIGIITFTIATIMTATSGVQYVFKYRHVLIGL